MPQHPDYASMAAQVRSLAEGDPRWLPLLANIAALIAESLDDVSLAGFYLLADGDAPARELVLGPFQGPLACTSIPWGKGVCGTAAEADETQLVANVLSFPGHIACDASSRSEVVVPVHGDGGRGGVVAVLDLDSHSPARFSSDDAAGLELVMRALEEGIRWDWQPGFGR